MQQPQIVRPGFVRLRELEVSPKVTVLVPLGSGRVWGPCRCRKVLSEEGRAVVTTVSLPLVSLLRIRSERGGGWMD